MIKRNDKPNIPTCHSDQPYGAKGLCKKCYLIQYSKTHRERHNQLSKESYIRNRKVILERAKAKRALEVKLHVKGMLARAEQRAKAKNLEFNLELNDLVIPKKCPVLGITLIWGRDARDHNPSLDRIDNLKGYTKDNIVIVSQRVNRIKTDATIDELAKVAHFYTRKQNR